MWHLFFAPIRQLFPCRNKRGKKTMVQTMDTILTEDPEAMREGA
jgi:hypothetical protein